MPPAVKAVAIPKKSGEERLLGVPTVSDRIAQMVVKLEFEPTVEPHFLPDSYGYRPGKSALDAIGVTRKRCWRYDWVVEFDIKGLFDNIPHDLLMKAVEKHTDSTWIRLYIKRWLTAPMQMPDGTEQTRGKGTPQGGVITHKRQFKLSVHILLTPASWQQAMSRLTRSGSVCNLRRRGRSCITSRHSCQRARFHCHTPGIIKASSCRNNFQTRHQVAWRA
jgi:hypothetical protein